jgi:hypothetical protein
LIYATWPGKQRKRPRGIKNGEEEKKPPEVGEGVEEGKRTDKELVERTDKELVERNWMKESKVRTEMRGKGTRKCRQIRAKVIHMLR